MPIHILGTEQLFRKICSVMMVTVMLAKVKGARDLTCPVAQPRPGFSSVLTTGEPAAVWYLWAGQGPVS